MTDESLVQRIRESIKTKATPHPIIAITFAVDGIIVVRYEDDLLLHFAFFDLLRLAETQYPGISRCSIIARITYGPYTPNSSVNMAS
jgi:hypothetical protein